MIKYIVFICFFLLLCRYPSSGQSRDSLQGKFEEPGFSVQFKDAIATSDGGFMVVGGFEYAEQEIQMKVYGYDRTKYPNYVQQNFWGSPVTIVHKVNSSGDSVWSKVFPISLYGVAIDSTNDGGFIIVGTHYSNRSVNYKGDKTLAVAAFKIDSLGELCWYKLIPSDYSSIANDMVVLRNEEILILADREYPPKSSYFDSPHTMRLLKLSRDGNVLMDKSIPQNNGIPYDSCYIPSKLIQAKDGSLYVLGMASPKMNCYLAQVTEEATIIRSKTFYWSESGILNELYFGVSLVATSSGIILACRAQRGEIEGQRIVKVGLDFTEQWSILQLSSPTSSGRLMVNEKDELYFLCTNEQNEAMLAKYSKIGNSNWKQDIEKTSDFEAAQLITMSDGSLIIVGSKHSPGKRDWVGIYFRVDANGNLLVFRKGIKAKQ